VIVTWMENKVFSLFGSQEKMGRKSRCSSVFYLDPPKTKLSEMRKNG
jgi:hypothetical protein